MDGTDFIDLIHLVPATPQTAKTAAAWDTHSHFHDPLENDETSPHAAVPEWERKGKNTGRTWGAIGGGLAGLALPAIAGFGAGAAGAYGLEHLMSGHAHVGSLSQLLAGGLGAAVAAPAGVASAPMGAGIGALTGEQAGGFTGKKLEQLYSPERQAAEQIRRLPSNHGLALIRTKERTGHGSPEELEAMRQTYNTRRSGLQDQVRAGVI